MSSQTSQAQPKRPPVASRQSSGSIHGSKSSNTNLSSSLQKSKIQRHFAAHPRVGPRVPSHGKNVNKMGKLLGQPADDLSASSRLSHAKRNSSNQQLARNYSYTDLKRNHSETSLRKNRSSGQLMKLTGANLSKNATKPAKAENKQKRLSGGQVKAPEGPINPTVRFDLGDDDDAWTEDSGSQSPTSTRNHTRQSSISYDTRPSGPSSLNRENLARTSPPPESQTTLSEPSTETSESETKSAEPKSPNSTNQTPHESRPPDVNSITSRLLNRNVAFNIGPRVSNISASAANNVSSSRSSLSADRSESPTRDMSPSREEVDGNDAMVSRFLNAPGSASTPGESSFIGRHEFRHQESSEENSVRRNKSASNVPRARSSASVHDGMFTPGTATPGALAPSRTQQKLWLERDSSNVEEQRYNPLHFYRGSRLPGIGMSFNAGGDGGNNSQLQQMLEQTDVEYSRVRQYQNPLAQAITRLQDAGITPKTKLAARAKGKNPLLGASGDANYDLGQSVKSPRAAKDTSFDSRRSKVSFQGIKGSKDDGELDRWSTIREDDDAETHEQARDICRKLWQTRAVVEAE